MMKLELHPDKDPKHSILKLLDPKTDFKHNIIGIDPSIVSINQFKYYKEFFEEKEVELLSITTNLVDEI